MLRRSITRRDAPHSIEPIGARISPREHRPSQALAPRRSQGEWLAWSAVDMNPLPNTSFLQSHHARIELARQRFFEEGQAPTGVVAPEVFESWSRCLRLHGNPHERAAFQPVTASRTQLALLKSQPLRQAWLEELPRVEAILGSTSCSAMLTDAKGVLIGSSCVGRSHEELMPVATRLGVDLSEAAVGTTAPGVAARTGKPVCVLGGEHFFDSVRAMHCAAAPIRDVQGRLAGVFDLSSEQIPFAFDAAALAGLFAGAIENRLLVSQSTEHLVIRFQVAPELIDSAMVGLIGIDTKGRLAWENGVARRLLGAASRSVSQTTQTANPAFDVAWGRLVALPTSGAAPVALPNGLTVWARAEMHAPDGRRGLVTGRSRVSTDPARAHAAGTQAATVRSSEDAPSTVDVRTSSSAPRRLRDSDLDLIRTTLQDCGGNVSYAAQRLGVSRGLIYRRLRASPSSGMQPAA
jgi:transcriptional regulator of acetoin/glycerol metabolism